MATLAFTLTLGLRWGNAIDDARWGERTVVGGAAASDVAQVSWVLSELFAYRYTAAAKQLSAGERHNE